MAAYMLERQLRILHLILPQAERDTDTLGRPKILRPQRPLQGKCLPTKSHLLQQGHTSEQSQSLWALGGHYYSNHHSCLIVPCLTLLGSYLFGGLFFSEEVKERVGSKEKGGTRGTGRNWGRENCGRDAFYER